MKDEIFLNNYHLTHPLPLGEDAHNTLDLVALSTGVKQGHKHLLLFTLFLSVFHSSRNLVSLQCIVADDDLNYSKDKST